jgi:hypothetical protein
VARRERRSGAPPPPGRLPLRRRQGSPRTSPRSGRRRCAHRGRSRQRRLARALRSRARSSLAVGAGDPRCPRRSRAHAVSWASTVLRLRARRTQGSRTPQCGGGRRAGPASAQRRGSRLVRSRRSRSRPTCWRGQPTWAHAGADGHAIGQARRPSGTLDVGLRSSRPARRPVAEHRRGRSTDPGTARDPRRRTPWSLRSRGRAGSGGAIRSPNQPVGIVSIPSASAPRAPDVQLARGVSQRADVLAPATAVKVDRCQPHASSAGSGWTPAVWRPSRSRRASASDRATNRRLAQSAHLTFGLVRTPGRHSFEHRGPTAPASAPGNDRPPALAPRAETEACPGRPMLMSSMRSSRASWSSWGSRRALTAARSARWAAALARVPVAGTLHRMPDDPGGPGGQLGGSGSRPRRAKAL